MNVIGHDHDGIKPNPWFECGAGVPARDSTLAQTVLQDQIA